MRTSIALAALGLCVLGCDSPTATTSAVNRPLFDAQGNGVMHQVSVGSSDIVPPGTDANFSLVAIQHGDGSVSGQWQDSFGKDAPGVGVHVAIDCVNVVGNEAWVSGVATDKTFAGQPVITRVAAPDQISFSIINPAQFGLSASCLDAQNLPLFPITNGQVKVR